MRCNTSLQRITKILARAMVVTLLTLATLGMGGQPNLAHGQAGTLDSSLHWQLSQQDITFESRGIRIDGTGHHLIVSFVGATPVVPTPVGKTVGSQTTPSQDSVIYHDLWPSVSLVYEARPGALLKSSFLVAPGSPDIGQETIDAIQLDYNAPVAIERDGSLRIELTDGAMQESAPVAWQIRNGTRIPVPASFHQVSATVIGFDIGDYDPKLPLVIDPILSWNTFLGGMSNDAVEGITVDNDGNVYIVGTSYADWGGEPVNAFGGGPSDAFAAKLNASGQLVWHTFLGSDVASDYGHDVAVDGSGNVYVAGASYAFWGSLPNTFGGQQDGFVAKLNSSGALQWRTFLGDIDNETANAIQVTPGNDIYVAGSSNSHDWKDPDPETGHKGGLDGFLLKVDTSGVVQWLTFMGSDEEDTGSAVAFDSAGNVFVTGTSQKNWGSPRRAYSAGKDAFAASFTSSNGHRTWNTFLGSAANDEGNGIAVTGDGTPVIVGDSTATWGASPVNEHAGGTDAFAARLTSDGNLTWNTFLGSTGTDKALGVAVRAADIYLSGVSNATWGLPQAPYRGTEDAFAARLSANGARQWNLFLGSAASDTGSSIAVAADRSIFVAGKGSATWGSSPVSAYSGSEDAFVARLSYWAAGRILSQGAPLVGVTVSASNGQTAITTSSGYFTVTGFITGTYTLTPTLTEHVFSPITRALVLPPDVTGMDFTAEPITYSISGQVMDDESQPLPDVTIHCEAITQTTNSTGVYTFTGLVAGTYCLTPTLERYRFAPTDQSVAVGPSQVNVDFAADRMGIFLPILIMPDCTELYITNNTSAGITYSINNTPQGTISCNISAGAQESFCGRFYPGTYQVQVNAPACEVPVSSGTLTFAAGHVSREVHCQ